MSLIGDPSLRCVPLIGDPSLRCVPLSGVYLTVGYPSVVYLPVGYPSVVYLSRCVPLSGVYLSRCVPWCVLLPALLPWCVLLPALLPWWVLFSRSSHGGCYSPVLHMVGYSLPALPWWVIPSLLSHGGCCSCRSPMVGVVPAVLPWWVIPSLSCPKVVIPSFLPQGGLFLFPFHCWTGRETSAERERNPPQRGPLHKDERNVHTAFPFHCWQFLITPVHTRFTVGQPQDYTRLIPHNGDKAENPAPTKVSEVYIPESVKP